MKIIDCFIFAWEIDMLKFRLEELKDVVDYFILVESNVSHAGKPKQLVFEENKELFLPYLDKIIHVIDENMPNSGYNQTTDKTSNFYIETWARETQSRRSVEIGIQQLELEGSDIILVSDCDEIPDSDSLQILKSTGIDQIHHLEQELYYYNFTCQCSWEKWRLAKAVNYHQYVNTYNRDCNAIRDDRDYSKGVIVKNGGWHLSYFGGVDAIMNKMKNMGHQEYNTEKLVNKESIEHKIKEKISVCSEGEDKGDWTNIPLEENTYLPKNYKMLL
jgi:beta-1,4-mannosyl-glycoprotein beta-1,4-N-acetylglucosaminyltransferase